MTLLNLPQDVDPEVVKLLSDPSLLKKKKPFTRGMACPPIDPVTSNPSVPLNEVQDVSLPQFKMHEVTQDQFLAELDPQSHKVLFDQNIPSITMKLKSGDYATIEYERMAVSFQRNILEKQVQHLCGNKMEFTLMNSNPTEKDAENFEIFRQYWDIRNLDGQRTKMVSAQKSVGDAGMLFYFDKKQRIKARLISYEDGYVICPHNDDNGDRILESVYYTKDGVEYIDSYDDTYFYRYRNNGVDENGNDTGWVLDEPVKHGFSEIPLITHRGRVAWDNVQSIIEVYEVIYNIFLVIQKRHGWGILYVKGKFSDKGQKIAGAIVLNDTTMDGSGSAEFKTPPSPQNMIDTLGLMEESIQKGSGTTFLLPKDVKTQGDVSGVAIQLTQSLDMENALQGVAEWQNVADKMCRLFKEGLATELVNTKVNAFAVTEFERLNISAKFRVWIPRSDYEYNNMLIALKGAGLLSGQTSIEKNTVSSPDEVSRIRKEHESELQEALDQERKKADIASAAETDEGGSSNE